MHEYICWLMYIVNDAVFTNAVPIADGYTIFKYVKKFVM